MKRGLYEAVAVVPVALSRRGLIDRAFVKAAAGGQFDIFQGQGAANRQHSGIAIEISKKFGHVVFP